jgi:predicted ATP-binding protein involved in virulence
MRLEHVRLENYGPIKTAELRLDPHFNVIVGVNGAGKTSILNAISIMLSRYSSAVRGGRAVGLIPQDAIRKGARVVQVEAAAADGVARFTWSAARARPGTRGGMTESSELLAYAKSVNEAIDDDPDHPLPLVAAYPVNRAVLDIPLRIRKRERFDQYAALDRSLLQGERNFRTFFAWYREREDVENETRARNTKYRDPQLNAVRKAVEELLPGFAELHVRRQPLRMLVTKGEDELRVDQLSDGEKTMLALAGDLARRLALANPAARFPLRGSAVVLIDELELHLHPAWQRLAVERLQSTFPKCQFIVTTHSPQVISEVRPEGVFLLRDGKIERPTKTRGRDSSLILEELMGAASRPKWAVDALNTLYESIDDDAMAKARNEFDQLVEDIGAEDPALAPAKLVLKRPRQNRR